MASFTSSPQERDVAREGQRSVVFGEDEGSDRRRARRHGVRVLQALKEMQRAAACGPSADERRTQVHHARREEAHAAVAVGGAEEDGVPRPAAIAQEARAPRQSRAPQLVPARLQERGGRAGRVAKDPPAATRRDERARGGDDLLATHPLSCHVAGG
eukprot:CAMPEP_0113278732 /NCGR_PEP_ID=MMETSP0008_2-20120614/26773_1 /TAXON_ID=97485 /ORGANISM="Prymnesium parvum" /LENGTH=156 /DNA_ID=CAMNT_0000128799 /DNA_START=476 /DNA_END=945 /DNA_ORIENTATION=+ /assembly_acc=CAM_ASM_000153